MAWEGIPVVIRHQDDEQSKSAAVAVPMGFEEIISTVNRWGTDYGSDQTAAGQFNATLGAFEIVIGDD